MCSSILENIESNEIGQGPCINTMGQSLKSPTKYPTYFNILKQILSKQGARDLRDNNNIILFI